jgi:hypothetical protein
VVLPTSDQATTWSQIVVDQTRGPNLGWSVLYLRKE